MLHNVNRGIIFIGEKLVGGGEYDLVTLSLLVGGCLMPYYCVCIGEVRMNSNGDREGEYVILATGEGEYPGHR